MINNIKRWFFNIADNRLFYAFDNKYNIVKKVIFSEDIRTSFEEFGDFQVTFLCEPFYYAVEDTIIIKEISTTSNTVYTFDNLGDFESEPNIKLYGNGSLSFVLNDVEITVNNVISSVEIDTKLLTCIGNAENKNRDLSADFPTFNIGANTIVIPVGTGITQMEIIPRTIYR